MVDVARTLDVLLREYPVKMKMLREARFEPKGMVYGTYQVAPGWAYDAGDETAGSRERKSPVNHFTLTEATFCTNQANYVALACMAQEGLFDGVKPLSLEAMNAKKFNGMVLMSFNADFREAFDSARPFEGTFEVVSQRLKRTRSGLYLFTQNKFTFEGEKSYGESMAAMQLSAEELINPGAL